MGLSTALLISLALSGPGAVVNHSQGLGSCLVNTRRQRAACQEAQGYFISQTLVLEIKPPIKHFPFRKLQQLL